MGEHVTERTLGDNVRMHARTFRLCTLFSSSELPVLVVCAAATSDTASIMILRCNTCFSSSLSSQRGI